MSIAIVGVINLVGLWALYWLYQDFRVDRYRQYLFDVRDRLFSLAAAGRIPFNHPTYGLMRSTMNGYIRLGNQMSLGLLSSIGSKKNQALFAQTGRSTFQEEFDRTARDLTADLRTELEAMRKEIHFRTFEHVVLSSWLVLLAGSVVALVMLVGALFEGAAMRVSELYASWERSVRFVTLPAPCGAALIDNSAIVEGELNPA